MTILGYCTTGIVGKTQLPHVNKAHSITDIGDQLYWETELKPLWNIFVENGRTRFNKISPDSFAKYFCTSSAYSIKAIDQGEK
jgi:hypothetical protein